MPASQLMMGEGEHAAGKGHGNPMPTVQRDAFEFRTDHVPVQERPVENLLDHRDEGGGPCRPD